MTDRSNSVPAKYILALNALIEHVTGRTPPPLTGLPMIELNSFQFLFLCRKYHVFILINLQFDINPDNTLLSVLHANSSQLAVLHKI